MTRSWRPPRTRCISNARCSSEQAATIREATGVNPISRARRIVVLVGVALLANVAYAQSAKRSEQKYPDVIAAKVKARGPAHFDFDVTISSPYDTPERYADAFRVIGKDGRVYGERVLLHDHADEQPFTRDLYGVTIPSEVRMIVVQARDRKYGYGGKEVEVTLPGR
jgi:hypothetical protein